CAGSDGSPVRPGAPVCRTRSAPRAPQLLEHYRVVLFTASLVDDCGEELRQHAGEREGHTELVGESADVAQVFQLIRGAAAGGVLAAQEALALGCEDGAGGEPA